MHDTQNKPMSQPAHAGSVAEEREAQKEELEEVDAKINPEAAPAAK